MKKNLNQHVFDPFLELFQGTRKLNFRVSEMLIQVFHRRRLKVFCTYSRIQKKLASLDMTFPSSIYSYITKSFRVRHFSKTRYKISNQCYVLHLFCTTFQIFSPLTMGCVEIMNPCLLFLKTLNKNLRRILILKINFIYVLANSEFVYIENL